MRLRGWSYVNMARELGLCVTKSKRGNHVTSRAERVRIQNAVRYMERSVGMISRAFVLGHHRTDEKQRKRLQAMARVYRGLVRHDTLDTFYWLATLLHNLAAGIAPKRGEVLSETEEDLLETFYGGFMVTDYFHLSGVSRSQDALEEVARRLRRKLRVASLNFVRLASVAPEPHPIEGIPLLKHAQELIAWRKYSPEIDAFDLAARAVQGTWLAEAELARAKDREALVAWIKGEIPGLRKATLEEVSLKFEIPTELLAAAKPWGRS
jgi:hypothetical protein